MRRLLHIAIAFGIGALAAAYVVLVLIDDDRPADRTVAVSCAELENTGSSRSVTRSARVALGAGVRVELCSNPSTGHRWLEPIIRPAGAVRLVTRTFIPAAGDGVGTPGTERFTFEALARGAARVELSYSQPWSGGQKRTWVFVLSLTVG